MSVWMAFTCQTNVDFYWHLCIVWPVHRMRKWLIRYRALGKMHNDCKCLSHIQFYCICVWCTPNGRYSYRISIYCTLLVSNIATKLLFSFWFVVFSRLLRKQYYLIRVKHIAVLVNIVAKVEFIKVDARSIRSLNSESQDRIFNTHETLLEYCNHIDDDNNCEQSVNLGAVNYS